MKVTLTLGPDRIENLKKHLGEDRITVVGEPDADGFTAINFEITSDWDVLGVIHAGVDSGFALGAYGSARERQAA